MNWSLVISALALGVSVFTYWKHDKVIKEQEHKINDYNIKQLQRNEEDNKKALLHGDICKSGNQYILTISNKGNSVARNIRISGLNCRHIWHSAEYLFPYELLNPTETISITIDRIGVYYIDRLPLTYHWDDNYANNRKKEQVVPLL